MSDLLTVADLAEKFETTTAKVLEWRRVYDWPHVRIGRKFFWTPEQVAEITRKHTVTSAGNVQPASGLTPLSARRSS